MINGGAIPPFRRTILALVASGTAVTLVACGQAAPGPAAPLSVVDQPAPTTVAAPTTTAAAAVAVPTTTVAMPPAPPVAVTTTRPAPPKPATTKAPKPAPQSNCDPSYPTVCIAPAPPDLDCPDVPYKRFKVLPPDPHRFDADHDGIGCET